MADKLALTDLVSLTNEVSALAAINNNNAAIETALDNTLSRDGSAPNTMEADLDMNSNKILNAATPTAGTDVANKNYVDARLVDVAPDAFPTGLQDFASATGSMKILADDGSGNGNITVDQILASDGISTIFYNLAATLDPTVNDDVNDGYEAGSLWYNGVSGRYFVCLSATAGAAVWATRDNHPGSLSTAYYPTYTGIHTAAPFLSTTDMYLHAFTVPGKITTNIANFHATTNTGSTATVKAAIYANSVANDSSYGRPTGAPLAVDNTGGTIANGITNANVQCTFSSSVTLWPGVMYWLASKCDSTTPTLLTIASTDYTMERLIGRSTLFGNTPLTGLSLANAFATNFPTITTPTTFTDVFNAGIPIGRFSG